MIDTDKYEECLKHDMIESDLRELAAELLAEVKRLHKELERLEIFEDFIDRELRRFVNSNSTDRIQEAIEKKLEMIE